MDKTISVRNAIIDAEHRNLIRMANDKAFPFLFNRFEYWMVLLTKRNCYISFIYIVYLDFNHYD